MLRQIKTLKFQISAVIIALAALFALSSIHTLQMLKTQRHEDALLRLATRLQLTSEQMKMRATNYLMNAPRDYESYYRDLDLYYGDLQTQVEEIGALSQAFAQGRFSAEQSNMAEPWSTQLDRESRRAAEDLATFWQGFRAKFDERMGTNPNEPRLEYGVEHIKQHAASLDTHINGLLNSLETAIAKRHKITDRLNRATILATLVLGLGILLWFVLRVIRPLNNTMQGIGRIAAGDFSHRLEIASDNEIGSLATSVNQLAGRLDALLAMLTRLQEGSDLDETLRFTAETMPRLLPLDWVGILFVSADGEAQLERAYCDGQLDTQRLERFPITETPLETALHGNIPTQIRDLAGLATSDTRFQLLRLLMHKGMRDAIFMPVADHGPSPGVLVFATRSTGTYTADHIELLTNISLLVTLSFARTLKLTEHTRLAAIGQFASGIAHELRSPLTTLNMALEYFNKSELPNTAKKRADLALGETRRMTRLLDDMLLYAKPMQLQTVKSELLPVLREIAAGRAEMLNEHSLTLNWLVDAEPELRIDPDRIKQVALNLLNNAIDAAPADSEITISLGESPESNTIHFSVTNQGAPIEPQRMERLFAPFFTTKSHGTGLGLGIVHRIVTAHGGSIEVSSEQHSGTRFTVVLPCDALYKSS